MVSPSDTSIFSLMSMRLVSENNKDQRPVFKINSSSGACIRPQNGSGQPCLPGGLIMQNRPFFFFFKLHTGNCYERSVLRSTDMVGVPNGLQLRLGLNSKPTTSVQRLGRGEKGKERCINKHAETHRLPTKSVSNSHSIKVSLQDPVRLNTG